MPGNAANKIVIVSREYDPHTDDVVIALQGHGHEPVRLNTENIPQKVQLAVSYGTGAWCGKITVDGRTFTSDTVRSVWWRRPGEYRLPDELSDMERRFATEETTHTFQGFWESLSCYWMSRPQNIQAASWKSGQFARAAQLGFDIPRMLISTDAAQARAFYEECRERVVYKVISDSGVVAPHQHALGMSAVLINAEQLEILDTVVVAPCLFQELLPKRADIRVTVIGEDVFAAELDSQAHEATRIDWRNAPLEIAYRKADLPVSIAERCLTFVRSYGLNFCALDLALTQDGRYLFLEAHPSGQFMWIEHKVPDLQMTDALVGCLIRGANR